MTDEAKNFENEAAQTRDRIADTIDELQARLSPKALVDNAIGSLGSAGSDAVASMRGAAAGHPLFFGLAGLAVGVGLLARSRVARSKIEYGDSYAAYADYDDSYAANLSTPNSRTDRARTKIGALGHQAHDTVGDSPLAVLVVGIATGALLGSIIPVSRIEHEMLGEARARLGAAGDRAVAVAQQEFSGPNLSLKGGIAGITDRLTQSLTKVTREAGAALGQPVTSGSAR